MLAATRLLSAVTGLVPAGRIAALLYSLRNLVYAAASSPIGALSDRMRKTALLGISYVAGSITAGAAALLFASGTSALGWLALLFCLAGVYTAAEDAIEGAIPADYVAPASRGAAYGLMGAVNGVGDFIASVLVGTMWTAVPPSAAFGLACIIMLAGALLMLQDSRRHDAA
jgi:MFS family permease